MRRSVRGAPAGTPCTLALLASWSPRLRPNASTLEPLFKAIAALRALPQVSIAMPDEIIFGAAQPVAKR